jgi:hypothetical protein
MISPKIVIIDATGCNPKKKLLETDVMANI